MIGNLNSSIPKS
jgi:pre-60S factor REI1